MFSRKVLQEGLNLLWVTATKWLLNDLRNQTWAMTKHGRASWMPLKKAQRQKRWAVVR